MSEQSLELKYDIIEKGLEHFDKLKSYVDMLREENKLLKSMLYQDVPFTLKSDLPSIFESDKRNIILPVAFSVNAELENSIHYIIKVTEKGNKNKVIYDYHLSDSKYSDYECFMKFWVAVGKDIYENYLSNQGSNKNNETIK